MFAAAMDGCSFGVGIRGGDGNRSFHGQACTISAGIVIHYGCLPFGSQ